MTQDSVDSELDLLCRAADAAAAVLAVDGRLAGPAAPQEDVGQLLVAEDVRGAWCDLDDGRVLVAFVATAALPIAAQGPEGSGVVGELQGALDAATAVLGAAAGPARVIVEPADLPLSLTVTDSDRPICGAGIFEGETPVASVGVRAAAAANPGEAQAVAGAAPAAEASGVSSGVAAASVSAPRNLHLLADVELGVSAELGRTTMSMGELLDLQPGGVIELQRSVGTPIDVLVNGTLIARGEVVVVDEAYAVRVTEVVADSADQ